MLSAFQLGISRHDFELLLRVRKILASGTIPRHKDYVEEQNSNVVPRLFNMNVITEEVGCGTASCIMGWMGFLHAPGAPHDHPDVQVYIDELDRNGSLLPLFYPSGVGINWNSIYPNDAVKAIDNFLNTGTPRWIEVIDNSVYDYEEKYDRDAEEENDNA